MNRHNYKCFNMPLDYIGQNLFIRPTYIVSLPEYAGDLRPRSYAAIKNQENLKDNFHKGVLSHKAISKMKNAVNWILCAAEPKKVYNKKYNSWFNFKVNFITLTLPDTAIEVDNKMLQAKLLNPFLTYLRTYRSLKNYVWKLEFQKNGKLHVHLVSDTFIHHAELRKAWNRLLEQNGLIDDFFAKFGHRDPNSTDIHSVKKIRNLGAYMAKYMTKQAGDLQNIKGRIWGCNQEVSRANKCRMFVDRDSCLEKIRPLMQSNIEYKALGEIDKYTGQFKSYGEMFYLKYTDWQHNIKGSIKESFQDTIMMLRGILTDDPLIFST